MVMVSRLLRDKQDTYRDLSHSHIFFQFASHFSVFFNNYTLRCLAHRIQKFFCIQFSRASSSARIYVQSVTSGRLKIFREEIITHTDTSITISSCVRLSTVAASILRFHLHMIVTGVGIANFRLFICLLKQDGMKTGKESGQVFGIEGRGSLPSCLRNNLLLFFFAHGRFHLDFDPIARVP